MGIRFRLSYMSARILLLSLLCYQIADASRYYVSPNGNDANSGRSLLLAFRTLQRSANVVNPGDTVLISDSTYAGFDLRRSGTSVNPIVYLANSQNVIINRRNGVTPDGINIENADWIVIKGFRVINQPRAGIRAVLSDHITVSNSVCTNNQRWGIFTGFTDFFTAEYNECAFSALEHGIYVSNSSDNAIIRNNISHHNRAAGLHFNGDISQGGDGINHSPQVYNNIIYNNGLGGGSAINMDGNQDALIYNNLIYENNATGIALYQIDGGGPSTGAKIFHNTIVQATNSRWAILLVDGAANATIKNNIVINQHSFRGSINIDAASLIGLTSDYNLFTNRFTTNDGNSVLDSTAWKALGFDQHSYFSPNLTNLFTNYSSGDLSLKSGSKAINFGTPISNPTISFDIANHNRVLGTNPDAGAYEFNSVALPLHWAKTSIKKNSNYIEIQGVLMDININTKVCLTKWSSVRNEFETIECKVFREYTDHSNILFKDYSRSNTSLKYQLVASEDIGNPIKSDILQIIDNAQGISVYPNPTSNYVHIPRSLLDITDRIIVQDVSGKIIKNLGVSGEKINLHSLDSGAYIISFISKNQIIKTSLISKY